MTEAMRKRLQESAYNTLVSKSRLSNSMIDLDPTLYPIFDDIENFDRLADIQNNIYGRVFGDETNKHLLICSEYTGNGKTSWAVKILKAYLEQDSWKEYHPYEDDYNIGIFIPTTKFVNFSKSYDIPQYRKQYYEMRESAEKAALVVFDDIGVAEYTKAEYTALLEIVDSRIFEDKMCIFTSNLTAKTDEVINKLGKRLADRIFDKSEIIQLRGEGVRH